MPGPPRRELAAPSGRGVFQVVDTGGHVRREPGSASRAVVVRPEGAEEAGVLFRSRWPRRAGFRRRGDADALRSASARSSWRSTRRDKGPRAGARVLSLGSRPGGRGRAEMVRGWGDLPTRLTRTFPARRRRAIAELPRKRPSRSSAPERRQVSCSTSC